MPASSVNIFRPGSTAPAAILYDAAENFQKRAPKADENIRSIRPDLAKAVDECIDAAGREWEPYWQRKLLNVSLCRRSSALADKNQSRQQNSGGHFSIYIINSILWTWGQILKVLNVVRYYGIGIPLTYAQ